ncbi:MAG: glycosyltransferase family 2 protein [Gemmataceae bacterium]
MIVVIPMAGGDAPFKDRGYPYCKSLIEIQGKPLVEHVWENIQSLPAERFVFLIRKEDAEQYHLAEVIKLLDERVTVVQTHGNTAGAACSVLLAIDEIDPERELVVMNGDQLIRVAFPDVVQSFRDRDLDGGAVVFHSIHPRWSFILLDENGLAVEAAEKRPISKMATAGFYYFRRGGDFLQAVETMIKKDANVNGQFYVCPAFNEMILRHARVGVYPIEREDYLSLATPQNVKEYEQRLNAEKGYR